MKDDILNIKDTVEDMFKWFRKTYGHKLYNMAFRVMWW